MRSIRRAALPILVFLIPAPDTHAQSPREQLKQMVEQLQKTPADNALREKIIKLAQEVKPAPAIPDQAVEFEGRAQFAFKSATSEADFLAAAREYEKAVAAAPWVPGYYLDLCTIYEKAAKLEDAKRNCQAYLSGLADPAQVTDMKRRIAGLNYGLENSPQAKANRQREKDEALIRSLNGTRFFAETNFGSGIRVRNVVEFHGQEAHMYDEVITGDGTSFQTSTERPSMRRPGDNNKPPYIHRVQGREFAHHTPWKGTTSYLEIAENGQEIRAWRRQDDKLTDWTSQNSTPWSRVR